LNGPATPEEFDVLIVGAGISGIAMARQLGLEHPGLSYAVLESRERIGGTWDLFRYPGIRSDSGMSTFAYSFRPWPGAGHFGDGGEIQGYLEATAAEYGIDRNISFGRRVTAADWDSNAARWTVSVAAPGGEQQSLTCRFLFGCTGYFDYEQGFDPPFDGEAEFGGDLFHAQHWPEGLDVEGREVVVVGSGATAVTMVPALTDAGARVTMLQRSPGYVVSVPTRGGFGKAVHRRLSPKRAAAVLRWTGILAEIAQFRLARRFPDLFRRLFISGARRQLPRGFERRHLNPAYDPWQQRVCFAPDGDFFSAISSGAARIETGRIERITADRIHLTGGGEIEADLIVKATGLEILVFGGIALSIDGVAVDPAERLVYRGAMLSGVPNFVFTVGYTNASWTLKSELIARFACRFISAVGQAGASSAAPVAPTSPMDTVPLLNIDAGYVRRAEARLPKAGDKPPWVLHQNWFADRRDLLHGELFDGSLRFDPAPRDPAAGGPAPRDTAAGGPAPSEPVSPRAPSQKRG
jgi:cation diffusion facilitator CzcD-associated flavoprotein CzcO